MSHGTAHLPSSRRYYLTARGISEAAEFLGFATPSDFVRAYPVSRKWLALLIRRMDAVATITLHDGRNFGVVRQGLALRRRSLYDRLRAIAGYDYTRRPETTLILTPSIWEQRLTTRFCMALNLDDCYVAVESRDALGGRDNRAWSGSRTARWRP